MASNLLVAKDDEHRRQAIGCYGNADVRTPALHQLSSLPVDDCLAGALEGAGITATGRYVTDAVALGLEHAVLLPAVVLAVFLALG